MERIYYVLKDKRPVPASAEEWRVFFGNIDNRCIAHTLLPGGGYVSTFFLGIDHRFFGEGPPLVFETTAFGLPGGADHDHMQRYCTWAEAELGHMEMVEQLTAADA